MTGAVEQLSLSFFPAEQLLIDIHFCNKKHIRTHLFTFLLRRWVWRIILYHSFTYTKLIQDVEMVRMIERDYGPPRY